MSVPVKSLFVVFFIIITACSSSKNTQGIKTPKYKPESQKLHDEIVQMDSLFFDAYNTCKVSVMDSLISADVEFYHDQGGLSTSKTGLLTALQNNICNKVTRILKKGSIEVYPIANYGAVEMGLHGFHNNQEPDAPSHFSKFVHIWKKENSKWKLTRVVSLH